MFLTNIALAEWPNKPFALGDLPVRVTGSRFEFLMQLPKGLQVNAVLFVRRFDVHSTSVGDEDIQGAGSKSKERHM